MTTQVSFDVTPADRKVVEGIVRRARSVESKYGEPRATIEWMMDIIATHANGNPLRLDDLLEADDFNFAHDVFGIARHLDRDTGKLGGFFSPRFSARA